MKTILFSLAICIVLSVPAYADCDREQAAAIIAEVQQKLADREDEPGSAVVWYDFHGGWENLTREQRCDFVKGLGSVEMCLTGKAIRIRVAGEDVARKSITGQVELYD